MSNYIYIPVASLLIIIGVAITTYCYEAEVKSPDGKGGKFDGGDVGLFLIATLIVGFAWPVMLPLIVVAAGGVWLGKYFVSRKEKKEKEQNENA